MPGRFTRTGGVHRLDVAYVAYVAAGDLDRSNFQHFLVDPEVDLSSDATFWAAMLARIPLSFALDLDTSAVDQQVQRPLRAPIRDVYGKGFLPTAQGAEIRHPPVQADELQQALLELASPSGSNRSRLDGSICRSALPNRTFIVKQVWIAVSP